MKITVGRNPACDYVVFDPQNRVSRRHAEIEKNQNGFFITDIGSSNGTFINGIRIEKDKKFKLNSTDKVTLSFDYPLDFLSILKDKPVDDDATKMFSGSAKQSVKFDNEKTVFSDGSKTVVFDTKKTNMGDLLQMDNNPYLTVGRSTDNHIKIEMASISRQHCKIKLLAPMIIEIVDCGSANGTFADDIRLEPNKKYQFSSSVTIKLGHGTVLDLKKVFKEKIEIVKKIQHNLPAAVQKQDKKDATPTAEEMKEFHELEKLWQEYQNRSQAASSASGSYSIGGAIISGVASLFGPVGVVVGIGASIFSRYLGMQKSNSLRNDINYEDAFLIAYSCPRCEESFQKRPWITIRDCPRCKTKYR
jgi:pSer/pThr/pTyr-binding forkhead associated (FHA) protein